MVGTAADHPGHLLPLAGDSLAPSSDLDLAEEGQERVTTGQQRCGIMDPSASLDAGVGVRTVGVLMLASAAESSRPG